MLGYSSMLVAAKVDPENPWRAAKIINSHPGVSHNYLRDHDFNIWFTIATEPDSQLGLEGTLDVLQRLTGAESVRQLPTLRLFKIRMDLEMEKGTEALAAVAEAVDHREPEAIELSDLDLAVIRATRGRWRSCRSRSRRPPPSWALEPGGAARAPRVDARAPRAAPRGRDPLPPPRRLLGQRHGRLAACPRSGSSSSARGWRRSAGSRTATSGPTYADWPYSVFTMAHGRSKEECDAILDSIAEDTGIEERRTLYSSTEFKKIRLRYFTDEHKRWEAEHA